MIDRTTHAAGLSLHRNRYRYLAVVIAAASAAALGGCGGTSPSSAPVRSGVIQVVAAENQYGNVAAQIGGKYVHVLAVASNPNIDPHSYEVSATVANAVAQAGLVVQNGLGYDDFMTKVESASPSSRRNVINVQHLLRLPNSTPNPHLWYSPTTMPAVAKAIATDLSALQPEHAAYFSANVTSFDKSLDPWLKAITIFKSNYAGTAAVTTEPVADYLIQAMGIDNLTPFSFQADIMNGTDPSPQGIEMVNHFITRHQAKVFIYNKQVLDALTSTIHNRAVSSGVPVVGVYETMPTPGYTYQSWMLAETTAIQKAITDGTSTGNL